MQKRENKLKVNSRMKALGRFHPATGKVEINVKAHKGDKKELASTIKHELLHKKYPKMTEKEVYKRSRKTKIAPSEQELLLRRLKGSFEPGSMIAEMNRRNSEARKTEIKKVLI